MTEVTVNTFSLTVQRTFLAGQPIRLTKDGVWAKAKIYLANPDADKDFNASTSGKDAAGKDLYVYKILLTDVFVRLCMFDQLYLKYGAKFWPSFYKQTRLDRPALNTTGLKMEYFIMNACKVSGSDLSDFFKKWG
ncbi:M60 family metallopeptidase [Chitinophaga sp. RAB17]|uniref:M60 family metallopeptidase n=1 Tax=Chitinophaga sp. RAB17 TaxID=3233049 RepID=UPI003F8E5C9F